MNYALGYSFTLKDMLITFPYRKLKTSSKQCESITGDYHRQSLFRRVFLESVKLIISDIIENNVTFLNNVDMQHQDILVMTACPSTTCNTTQS